MKFHPFDYFEKMRFILTGHKLELSAPSVILSFLIAMHLNSQYFLATTLAKNSILALFEPTPLCWQKSYGWDACKCWWSYYSPIRWPLPLVTIWLAWSSLRLGWEVKDLPIGNSSWVHWGWEYRKVPIIGYHLYMGIPYIRVHFINDQCAIVVADILNIGDYSARSPLSFLGSRWFCHTCVYLWNFSVVLGTPWDFPIGAHSIWT